jgi:hypothetical protein
VVLIIVGNVFGRRNVAGRHIKVLTEEYTGKKMQKVLDLYYIYVVYLDEMRIENNKKETI